MIARTIPHELHDYFDRVYWPRRLNRAEQTRTLYRLTLDRFRDYLGMTPTLGHLNDTDVCAFLQSRLTAGRAEHTVDKERDKIVALANFAARKRHIEEFLDVPPIDPTDATPQCWRVEDVQRLLKTCREYGGLVGACPASLWWTALHLLILTTGERTGAATSIRWEWLASDGWLRIPGTFGGSRVRKFRKPAAYQLPAFVVESLEQLRPFTGDGPTIFAMPWSKGIKSGTFYRRYETLLKVAGLPTGRKWKPHALRRTFASYLDSAGADATDALLHGDRRVTKASYLDPGVSIRTDYGAIAARELGLS